jgi:translation initiation factor 2 alpha subunit (eIF-2alpha)
MFKTAMFAAALSAVFAGAAVADGGAEHKSTYFDFAKITVAERARADGYLRVRLTPENGTAREATLDIHKRMSENDIAKGIAVALEPVVGPEYRVERTAGEHVKLQKASKDAANFAVEIAFNVPGFSIVLEN